MIGLRLEPVDTWFFRDGTPFTKGDSPQENVGSLFPPPPATVVGALRAALARSRGWGGRGSWPPEICEILGDGPDDLGQLRFDGPFLLREKVPASGEPPGAERPVPLFRGSPAPAGFDRSSRSLGLAAAYPLASGR